jgi:hypothetical protein
MHVLHPAFPLLCAPVRTGISSESCSMLSFVQHSAQAATWPEKPRREICAVPFGKAMFSFGVSSSPLLCNHLTSEDLVDSRPCAWRELQGREYLAGFFVKLGGAESHFDRLPERRLSRSDPTSPHTHTSKEFLIKADVPFPPTITWSTVLHSGTSQETPAEQRHRFSGRPRSCPNCCVWES